MALTETTHAGGFILSEANGNRSRESGILNAGQHLTAGTVVGRLLAATGAAVEGNTGNGALTVGAPGKNAQIGEYTLVCVAAATDAGTFNFYSPDGVLIRQVTVGGGAAANDHITVTIADGTADFVAGDAFTITVAGGDYEALGPAEDDGAQIAAGILYDGVDATLADAACVVVVRDTTVNQHELVWPDAITADQKAAAIAQLNARGIILR